MTKFPPSDALDKLCALAPAISPAAPAPSQSNIPKGKKHAGKSPPPKLIVESYLQHYGIEYKVKHDDSRTIYQLKECLFDPSHGNKQASIIEAAGQPLHYQCFHDSCKGRTFVQAREIISGKDSLAPYCEGYNPTRKQSPRATTTQAPDSPESPGDALQAAAEEKPFLRVNDKGHVTFNPALFADHLAGVFAPVVNEGKDFGGLFYKYHSSGLWQLLPVAEILNYACTALNEDAKTNRIADSFSLMQAKKYVAPEKLLPDPMWMNLKNCMLHIETLECRPHAPEFNSRVQLPIQYNEAATCPVWIDGLAGIFSDDTSKCDVLQEFFGYCLYPRILFPCAIFGIGRGGNGKGTVQRVLEAMLGDTNVSHISLQRMEEKFGPIELKDKLLNACGETSNTPLEVTRFKEICAADKIQAEVKYQKDVIYVPIAKHYISMNEFPGIKDKTDAFFRRIVVLEYRNKFEGDNDDTYLGDKLLKELDGIFMWSIAGLKRVLARGSIAQPETVQRAKRRMKSWVNPVLNFVDECCLLGPLNAVGNSNRCWPAELFRRYLKWCEEGNSKAIGKQRFYEHIFTNFDVKRGKDHDATREHFEGLSIRAEEQLSF